MNLKPEYQKKIIAILSALFPDAKIYLFGSRARGTNQEFSDIDIALDAGKKLRRADVGEARDMLGESNIPYKIDLVDFQDISEAMRKFILQEGVLWKS
ncbi:nucleotidyltransferase domain-containing protein [bacterium]|nr:MAG: nucleotidyltransferase domain-containing protein [bacterium]